MSYEIIATPNFSKEIKKLAKKYNSIKADFAKLLDDLNRNPACGVSLGNNCYKIRMAVASKGKGKSSGSRVITHIKKVKSKVYLLSIYDKSEQDSISNKELKELIAEIPD